MIDAHRGLARKRITAPLKRALLATGHYHRTLRARRFPGVAVLCYHAIRPASAGAMPFAGLHVTAEEFEGHCRFLREACDPIGLDAWPLDRPPSVARPVLVTFDDGYQSVLDVALPILERWQIPAVVFLATGAIATGRSFWYDALALEAGEAAVGEAFDLGASAWRARVESLAAVHADAPPPLGIAGVAALARAGVALGAHTVSHPRLAELPRAEQEAEIAESCAQVTAWSGAAPAAFAYPFGGPDTYDALVAAPVLRRHGITTAFTTEERWALGGRAGYELPRFVMLHSFDAGELAHRLTYAWHA